jgi:PAS domain S-box-containing protein
VGLTAEDCLRVFEAYEKAPVAEGGGTGLGLYTSRAFARLLGGDLTVVSRKGHGSTFTMRVPVRVLGLGGDSAPIAGADAAVAPVAAGPPMPLPAPAASGAAPLPGAESDLVETMLQRLMEHASDIFAVLDPLPNAPAGPESLRLSFVSPNIERVLGWRPTDLIGRSCTDFMYAPDVLMHMVALQELFSGGLTSMQGMRRMVCANGSLRWMHVDICMHDGALMCVARDATRQKATQKALNEFLLSTSHDLRTPVHSILTGTQLLGQRESVRGDAEAAFLLDAVLGARRLARCCWARSAACSTCALSTHRSWARGSAALHRAASRPRSWQLMRCTRCAWARGGRQTRLNGSRPLGCRSAWRLTWIA